MRTSSFFHFLVIVFSVSPFTAASAQQQIARLHSVGTIVDGGPYSFPEKVTLYRFGKLYVLDSELSNIFMVGMSSSGARINPLCSPRTPVAAADLTVESNGSVWIFGFKRL